MKYFFGIFKFFTITTALLCAYELLRLALDEGRFLFYWCAVGTLLVVIMLVHCAITEGKNG